MAEDGGQLENEDDLGKDPDGIAARWRMELKLSDKDVDPWFGRCSAIIKRYRDDRSGETGDAPQKRFAMLWSWFRTMQPAIYSQTPKVQAKRRFLDRDPMGRLGSEVIERGTGIVVEDSGFDPTMRLCVADFLLCGRGVAWVRYDPTISPEMQMLGERTVTDYIHWRNFRHSAARHWEEVRWIAKELFFTRAESTKHFGEKIAKDLELDYRPSGATDADLGNLHEAFKKTRVWEIWDKPSKSVIWISPSYKGGPLKTMKDPLGLKDFFPVPRPLYDTTTSDSLIPVPSFCEWQDLAYQLDEVMVRRLLLTEALNVSGVYPANCKEIARLLTENRTNKLIPVENWPQFVEQGGMRGVVQFMSLQEISQALRQLDDEAELIKKEIYEITGWSDIMRGTTNPYETRGAQEIKSGWASNRLKEYQREIQRFARDIYRIHAEIIVEHFSPETLAAMIGAQVVQAEGQQQFMQVLDFLKNDKLRSYAIDIETDSTLQADEQQERQGRVEFLQVLTPFLEQMIQVSSSAPQLLPACSEAIMFAIRTFKQGAQSLETAFEQGTQEMVQYVQQQQQQQAQQGPAPDPAMAQVQAKAQVMQLDSQTKAQSAQAAAQTQLQTAQMTMEIAAQKTQAEQALATEKMQMQAQVDQLKAEGQQRIDDAKAAHDMQLQREKEYANIDLRARQAELSQMNKPSVP